LGPNLNNLNVIAVLFWPTAEIAIKMNNIVRIKSNFFITVE